MIDYTPKYIEQGKDKAAAEKIAALSWFALVIVLLIIVLMNELKLMPNASKTKESTPTMGTEATTQAIGKNSRCEFLPYTSLEEMYQSLPESTSIVRGMPKERSSNTIGNDRSYKTD